MSNDSTTAGYITAIDSGPSYDETLERSLSQWFRALSGLPASMVRPRWMPTQPAMPGADVNWCGFGITGFLNDNSPAFVNQSDDSAQLWRHEIVETMGSFYGPGSQSIAMRFRDALTVQQNNEELSKAGLTLAEYSNITPFPELINNQWVRRYDITISLRRKVIRDYGIKTLVSAPVTFFGD